MPAISGIWLIGCHCTWPAFDMRGISSWSGHGGFGVGTPARRLEVAAIWNDVGVGQRGDPCQILVVDLVSGGTELLDDTGDVDSVPDQHGIGQQAEAAGLVHHLLVVAGAEA